MIELIKNFWKGLWDNNIPTTIGGLFALIQFGINIHNSKLNNELNGAPRFYFTEPSGCNIYNNSDCAGGDFEPEITIGCGGERRVCWFGIANMGRFAARNVKIAIAKEDELSNILTLPEERYVKMDYWGGNTTDWINNAEIIRFTTPLKRLEIAPKDRNLYVFLEYQSDYSRVKYRYLYQWCISDDSEINNSNGHHSIAPSIKFSDLKEALKEAETTEGVKSETAQSLANAILNRIKKMPKENYIEMGFSRPVFLHEVRTVKATSSNKVHWRRKLKVRHERKRSKTLDAKAWLNDYWS